MQLTGNGDKVILFHGFQVITHPRLRKSTMNARNLFAGIGFVKLSNSVENTEANRNPNELAIRVKSCHVTCDNANRVTLMTVNHVRRKQLAIVKERDVVFGAVTNFFTNGFEFWLDGCVVAHRLNPCGH